MARYRKWNRDVVSTLMLSCFDRHGRNCTACRYYRDPDGCRSYTYEWFIRHLYREFGGLYSRAQLKAMLDVSEYAFRGHLRNIRMKGLETYVD